MTEIQFNYKKNKNKGYTFNSEKGFFIYHLRNLNSTQYAAGVGKVGLLLWGM